MDNKLIYIPNEDKQNYLVCRFNYLLKRIDLTNGTSIEVPIILGPSFRTLDTSVIKNSMSFPPLEIN